MYQGKWTGKAVRKRNDAKNKKEYAARSKKARSGSGWLSTLLLGVSILICLYAVVQIVGYRLDRAASQEAHQQLSEMAVEIITAPTETAPPPTEAAPSGDKQTSQTEPAVPQTQPVMESREKAPIQVDFQLLKQTSRDIIGWLYCPDTPINYPVMRSKNNLDYIRKLPNGTPNDTGSLFLDFRNEDSFLTGYSIIYGHNMKDDSMFGSLEEYKKQEYFEAHSVLYLITEAASYRIDPIAGVVTTGTSGYYALPMNPDAIVRQISEGIQQSTFYRDTIPDSDIYLLLSTCDYTFDDGRFLLLCTLTEID